MSAHPRLFYWNYKTRILKDCKVIGILNVPHMTIFISIEETILSVMPTLIRIRPDGYMYGYNRLTATPDVMAGAPTTERIKTEQNSDNDTLQNQRTDKHTETTDAAFHIIEIPLSQERDLEIKQETTDSESNISAHNKDSNEPENASDKPFACRMCSERFHKRYHLTKHSKVHRPVQQEFKCFVCGYICSEKKILNKHLDSHIHGNPYSCHLCDFKCKDKSTLIQHVKEHAGERPYACDYCDHRSKSREHLKLHVRIHTGDKPFSCRFCDYRATRNSMLVVHMRTHTGEKPYICDICNSKFNQRCHLTTHMRTHTGVRPYSCAHCDYSSKQKSNLKVHMRVHTGEKPYVCHLCNTRFIQKNILTMHLRRHDKSRKTRGRARRAE